MVRRPVMEDIPDTLVISEFKGVRNTTTSERLKIGELVDGKDIDIDDAEQIKRRRGQTKVKTGDYHSLYNSPIRAFVVKAGILGVLNPDYSFTSLAVTAGLSPVAFVTVEDTTYFSSATVSGKIVGTVVSDWGAIASDRTWLSPVINPSTTLPDIHGKLLGPPPLATILAYFNGRIYLAEDDTLWATELYLYDYVEKVKNYLPFEDKIQVVGAVADGLYVGTDSAIWFLSGTRLGSFTRIKKRDEGAISQSLVYAPMELISPEESQLGTAVVFRTKHSVVAGFPGGTMYDMTERQAWLPDATIAPALFRAQDGVNQYVGVAESGGTPSSATRIGDYVDAEIIRPGGT